MAKGLDIYKGATPQAKVTGVSTGVSSSLVIDTLNPTGKIFTDYTPEQRATAELGKNITTLDKTMSKLPDDTITIYRGSDYGDEIVPGDFITNK